MTIDVNKLGRMLEYGYGLTAYCDACGHFAAVDLSRLIEKFGPDFDTVDNRGRLVSALKCSRCRSSSIDIRLRGPTGFDGR